jgi:peptidoglycan-associated lipoprotein
MDQLPEVRRISRLALVCSLATFLISGCATSASYRPEIDRMKGELAEAKAAGAETFAAEEYASAEACLDWYTHYVTQFDHFGDVTMANLPARCRAAFASLRSKLVATREGRVPAEAVATPAAPKPEAAAPAAARGTGKESVLTEKESVLKDAFFDFDKSSIQPDAKQSLDENAKWLKANPNAALTIEGHCDERGTGEYNLGLGQRRAKAAKDYLVSSGINAKRIKIISYGKERPFVPGHDESAWKWNRRAHFVLQ